MRRSEAPAPAAASVAAVVAVLAACSFVCATAVTGNGSDAAMLRQLRVGAVLDSDDTVLEAALNAGVAAANRILAGSRTLADARLVADIRRVEPTDGYQAARETCHLLSKGVVAVVGPSSLSAGNQVRSVCEYFTVPHVDTRSVGRSRRRWQYSVNLLPHPDTFGQVVLDFVRAATSGGQGVAVVYSEPETLLKFQLLLNSMEMPVLLRRWRRQRQALSDLQLANVKHFIVDIPPQQIVQFLLIARSLNMSTPLYSFLLTSLDAQRYDLSDFQAVRGANITTLSLLPPGAQYNGSHLAERMRRKIFQDERHSQQFGGLLNGVLPTAAATLYDSLQLLARAMQQMASARYLATKPVSCTAGRQFLEIGSSLLNYMRSVSEDISQLTLTGPLKFDAEWRRVNLSLRAMELTAGGFQQLGVWTSSSGFRFTKPPEPPQQPRNEARNKTLRVTTIPDPPFVVIKERDADGNPLPEPSAWDGFCIEMLNLIALDVGFNYSVHVVRDRNYGAVNGTDAEGKDTWNGMINELIQEEADLAVASLTITYERERVIDFTTPYMALGLSILFKKPENETPLLFFLQPLSGYVWGFMLAAYVTVSVVLFLVGRVSPYEWYNPYPCDTDPTVVENQFSMMNSFWFTIGSLMQQGSEITPRSLSTRIVSGTWWFFTLIMVSSYTANLAAFLTVVRMQSPIESATDLAHQTEIEYGSLSGGSTYQFFQRSQTFPVYKKMWDYMSRRPGVFVNRTEEGVQRVKRGGYAFILESTWNEYYTQRNCDLMRVGGLLDSKGYGIGLPQGSQYRDQISESILKSQKNQDLENLRRKWWREKNITERCEDTKDQKAQPEGLGIDQVLGVYVVLLLGVMVGMATVAAEFYVSAYRRTAFEKQGIGTELCQELQFAVRCFDGSKRPANHLAQRALRARGRHLLQQQQQSRGAAASESSFLLPGNERPAKEATLLRGDSAASGGGGGGGSVGHFARPPPREAFA